MDIKKGQKLVIEHARTGKFNAIATEDFDTNKVTFYPIMLDSNHVSGHTQDWYKGEKIPCRASLVLIIEKRG